MSNNFRQNVTELVATELAKRPTMSISSTVAFFNTIMASIQPLILANGHPVVFDIGRNNIGKQIIKIGQAVKHQNIEYLNSNMKFPSIAFDHWSKNGKNFFGAIARTSLDHQNFREYVVGFFEANTIKTAQGYIEDLGKLIKTKATFEMPLMSDNCATMLKAGKISTNFRKVHCAVHKLAVIDDKIHKTARFATMDTVLTKINGYFNYRHERFCLPLKPQTCSSTTRAWRSHDANYTISLRNFDRYEQLFLSQTDFPSLPSKLELIKVGEFQKTITSYFEILEEKSSDLLDQLDVFIKLHNLSLAQKTTELIGTFLTDLLRSPSTINAFLSDDTLAYAYLSKMDFEFVFGGISTFNADELLKRAILKVERLYKQNFAEKSDQASKTSMQPTVVHPTKSSDCLSSCLSV